MSRDQGKPSVTIFGSWKPTFISFYVQKHVKHTLKLKNISMYYYLQKASMSITMTEEGQFKC